MPALKSRPPLLPSLALGLSVLLGCATARADQQQDPGLRDVVASAITQAQCFPDRFDSAVWYKLM